jgi:predicted nucleic acid-binding Zn ribbon protein
MPMYLWKCPKCEKEIQVIRSVSDIEEQPTKEEGACDCEEEMSRVLCAPMNRWRYCDE